MSDLYSTVCDNLARVIGQAQGRGAGYHYDLDGMTLDQQLRVLQIQAILALVEEVSDLNPKNTTFVDDQGVHRNGWGLETHDDRFRR